MKVSLFGSAPAVESIARLALAAAMAGAPVGCLSPKDVEDVATSPVTGGVVTAAEILSATRAATAKALRDIFRRREGAGVPADARFTADEVAILVLEIGTAITKTLLGPDGVTRAVEAPGESE